jgi:hypothetical protein
MAVRQRVFERAYALSLLVGLIGSLHLNVIFEYGDKAQHVLMLRLLIGVGIIMVSLPSILAAWQKDS